MLITICGACGKVMVKRNNDNSVISDLNVVPYIDVLLVLIVILLVAMPIMLLKLPVNLPSGAGNKVDMVENTVSLYVQSGSTYQIGINGKNIHLPSEKDLSLYLSKNKHASYVIQADAGLSYQSIVTLLTKFQNLGIDKVSLATKSEN